MSGSEVTIAVYREKVHPVQAVRFETNNDDGSHIATIVGWANSIAPHHQHLWTDNTRIFLEDLVAGRRSIEVGDWLLRHGDGRLSAMDYHFFEIEYEPMPSEVGAS